MWRSNDGVVHVVAVPPDHLALVGPYGSLSQLAVLQLRELESELLEIQWETADHIDELGFTDDTENQFVDKAVPDHVLTELDWASLIQSSRKSAEIEAIDIRWRLDVVGILLQAIADLESERY